MDEKQLQQINQNIRTSQISSQPEPISRLLTSEIDSGRPEKPESRCSCGCLEKYEYADFLNRWVNQGCPVCSEQQAERERLRREHEKDFQRIQTFNRIIPPLFHTACLDDLSEKLKSTIMLKPFHQGLLLWGGVGVGKTHTSAAMTRWYITEDRRVYRLTFKELLLKLRSTYENGSSEESVYRPLLNSEVLVLEDVATGKPTEFTTDTLLYVVDSRLEHCKPTIITSNLSPERLEEAFGQRIGSRLADFLTIKLSGVDMRRQK